MQAGILFCSELLLPKTSYRCYPLATAHETQRGNKPLFGVAVGGKWHAGGVGEESVLPATLIFAQSGFCMSAASTIVLPRLRLSSKRVISAQIYDFLRKLIIETTIKPGTLLSENALSEHFHVSRQPVREALMGLSYEGLLSVLPQRGSVVERISVSALQQAVFIRTAIEKECLLNFIKLDKHTRTRLLQQIEKVIAQQHECDMKYSTLKLDLAEESLADKIVTAARTAANVRPLSQAQAAVDAKRLALNHIPQHTVRTSKRRKSPTASMPTTLAPAAIESSDVVIDDEHLVSEKRFGEVTAATPDKELNLDKAAALNLEQERQEEQETREKEWRATYLRLDDAFHERLCSMSGAPMAWDTVQLIKGQMDRIRFFTFHQITPTEVLTNEHWQIFEGLKAENYPLCLTLLEAHLSTINESHKSVMRRYRDWFSPESLAQLDAEDEKARLKAEEERAKIRARTKARGRSLSGR